MHFPRLRPATMANSSSSEQMNLASATVKASDYVKVRGLRMVRPYYFDFKANVKARWRGRSVVEIFTAEFPARDVAYYEQAFADGRLRVSGGNNVGLRDPLLNGMAVHHYLHRHEPPVLDVHIPILGQTEELVAVGKPASMPVHVSGQYRKNTLLHIVEAEHPELGTLLPVHRLDKSVSGVLLFARSKAGAENMRHLIQDQAGVEKTYIARVLGVFPEGMITVKAGLSWDAKWNMVYAVEEGVETDAAGREAKVSHTDFQRLSVSPDGKTSLVKCWPRTGRTHQIRVHLQYLGHPVANDMQYGGTYWGPRPPFLIPGTAAAKRMLDDDHVGPTTKRQKAIPLPDNLQVEGEILGVPAMAPEIERLASLASLQQQSKPDLAEQTPGGQPGEGTAAAAPAGQNHDRSPEGDELGAKDRPEKADLNTEINPRFSWLQNFNVPDEDNDPACLNCPRWVPANYPLDLVAMWLHAMEYSSTEWSFKCPPPPWAEPSWVPSEFEMH